MFKPPAHKSGTAASIKMSDGCCHGTVVERCKDCSYGPNVHADAGPLTRQIDDFKERDIRDYYTQRQGMNTTQRGKLAAAIGKEGLEEALKGLHTTHTSLEWESRYNRLVGALERYMDDVGDTIDRQGEYITTQLGEIIESS